MKRSSVRGLDLQSTQNDCLHTQIQGLKAMILGANTTLLDGFEKLALS